MKFLLKIGKIYSAFFALILVIIIATTTLLYLSNDSPKEDSQKGSKPSEVLSEKISDSDNNQKQLVKVERVIDGDTIEIEGGQKVRYIGIDTPETVHPEKSVQCFGADASAKNKELVEGKEVRLEKDVSETDRYGRLLRYVYIENTFINKFLVEEGYAYASSYPPDIKYQNQLQQAQREAQENKKGLWSTCSTPQSNPQTSSAPLSTGQSECAIKGNISSSGEKIYHVPGQRYYEKTIIDPSKGEQMFCYEDEAIKGGWRKSKI